MCCHNVFRRVGKAVKKGARKAAKVVIPLAVMSLTGGGAFGSLASIGKGASIIGKGLIKGVGAVGSGLSSGLAGGVSSGSAVSTTQTYAQPRVDTAAATAEIRAKTQQYLAQIEAERASVKKQTQMSMNKIDAYQQAHITEQNLVASQGGIGPAEVAAGAGLLWYLL
jgi:hypothetical protein